jgi:hypothetical protein
LSRQGKTPSGMLPRDFPRRVGGGGASARPRTGFEVWTPRELRVAPSVTLIMLDWDDTLLPTSYARNEPPGRLCNLRRAHGPETVQAYDALDVEAVAFLSLCASYGRTVIVTNATVGWVAESARRHMPRTHRALPHLRVISAREAKLPGTRSRGNARLSRSSRTIPGRSPIS